MNNQNPKKRPAKKRPSKVERRRKALNRPLVQLLHEHGYYYVGSTEAAVLMGCDRRTITRRNSDPLLDFPTGHRICPDQRYEKWLVAELLGNIHAAASLRKLLGKHGFRLANSGEVCWMLGVSASTLGRLRRHHDFPAPSNAASSRNKWEVLAVFMWAEQR